MIVDNIKCIKYLLYQAGYSNEYDNTALMNAARLGYAHITTKLRNVESGNQNNYGVSALMFAARKGFAQCV